MGNLKDKLNAELNDGQQTALASILLKIQKSGCSYNEELFSTIQNGMTPLGLSMNPYKFVKQMKDLISTLQEEPMYMELTLTNTGNQPPQEGPNRDIESLKKDLEAIIKNFEENPESFTLEKFGETLDRISCGRDSKGYDSVNYTALNNYRNNDLAFSMLKPSIMSSLKLLILSIRK